MSFSTTLAFGALTTSLLTPLAVTLWSRIFPPSKLGIGEDMVALKARNGWIDAIATVCMLAGIFAPMAIFGRGIESAGIWAAGLGFGLMVSLHFLWVCVATIPFGGLARFREFWRFYELRWGIAMKGIRIAYIPISLIGLLSLFMLSTRNAT